MNGNEVIEAIKLAFYGSPIAAVILGLVTFYGRLGLKGNKQLLSAFATGLVLGGIYMYAVSSPTTLLGWLGVIFYGLVLALVAVGVYETGKEVASKSYYNNAKG